ncbi:FAH family protein [Zobellella endophytica]|uniref:FAH family protein n=1 Tax=Zobellella endophytica TaxID=2116700 RepID=A0A2P7QXD5_9GAMM|nr:AraD1 family protein [Zobellella endophytica]PSJ42604.1 FAH family protein [Zobellella endophytica]
MRLIQFEYQGRLAVGTVEDNQHIRLLEVEGGTYQLARDALAHGRALAEEARLRAGDTRLDYEQIVREGRLRAPLSHPDPAHCLVTGTGLTHLGSADTRSAMHARLAAGEETLTDSMKMFKLGLDGGKPAAGEIGAQPEWFYKGDGSIVVDPEAPLPVPAFAEDAGEEPELVGLYLIDEQGHPWRLGYAVGNEFSDHVTEKANYLWLAHSKLRACSFGPELLLDPLPVRLEGQSRILRNGEVLWQKPFVTGEENMAHSFANLEHHHFKYAQFRRPGDVHVHFFGTSTLSFGDGIQTREGDVFEISLPAFGRPLRNPVAWQQEQTIATVRHWN